SRDFHVGVSGGFLEIVSDQGEPGKSCIYQIELRYMERLSFCRKLEYRSVVGLRFSKLPLGLAYLIQHVIDQKPQMHVSQIAALSKGRFQAFSSFCEPARVRKEHSQIEACRRD